VIVLKNAEQNACNCYEKYGGIKNLITNCSTAP